MINDAKQGLLAPAIQMYSLHLGQLDVKIDIDTKLDMIAPPLP